MTKTLEKTLNAEGNTCKNPENKSFCKEKDNGRINLHTEHDTRNPSRKGSDLEQNLPSSPDDDSEKLDFPEGGLKAWLCVLGSFLGLTNVFGIVNSSSAIEAYISKHQLADFSASAVGWVFSIYLFISMICGVFAGHLFDVHGPRIFIFAGTILTFAGVFAMGSCTTLVQFIFAFGLVAGLGSAVQMSAIVGILSHYFNRKRGIAIGLATVGGSFGGTIFPIMLRRLYSEVGFTWAIRIYAFVLAFFNIGALVLVSPRFPPRRTPSDKQGTFVQRAKNYFCNIVDFKALKDPEFLFCAIGVALSEIFLMCSITYYSSFAIFVGKSESTAYLLITVMNAVGIVARIVAGYLSDKLGRYNLMIVMVFAASLFCLIIWLPFGHHTGGLYAFSVAYGIASPAVLSLAPLCVGQISKVEDFGKRYATCYSVVAIGLLIGIPISGVFIGSDPTNENYTNFIIFISVIGIVCTICMATSRFYSAGFRPCVY